MLFAHLVATSAAVAAVSGRLDKVGRLAALLRGADPHEIAIVVSFLSGVTRQGRVGVGYAAVAKAADTAPAESPSLTVRDVDAAFAELAAIAGKGAGASRAQALGRVFARATRDEQDFLRRLIHGELRQGAQEGVLVDAVARAASVTAARVRRAAMLAGDLATVAHSVLTRGDAALDEYAVHLMRPVQPMLADSADSVEAALAGMGDAAVEYKLDGARIQLHKDGDEVRLFSRALNDVTAAAPEVVELARQWPIRTLVLDGEVIALDPDGRPKPFQITMRRFGRRLNVEQLRAELPLTPFFFDVLYADGTSLLDEPLERRAEALQDVAPGVVVPRVIRPTPEAAAAFARAALERGHEGVMAKALDAPYAAGRRGSAWQKIKQARTLDLVVLAAEWGNGRRQGWLSNLHLGARDPDTGGFVMLGKTFKGMTDEMLAWQTQALLALETARDAYTVYVRPELVVEVAFNEVQDSPVYPGGLALRFARVKRYRTDKTADGADTIGTVRVISRP
jgi:DNA ligase-1